MRPYVIIFLSYLGATAMAPSVCGIFSDCDFESQNHIAMDCGDEPSDEAPCLPCCGILNCDCEFMIYPSLEVPLIFEELVERTHPKNDHAMSNYLSEIWRPPQFI